ncbi:MAG: hypothetical protein V1911_00775 [Candidatus Micrarchaeota archaeon]
MKEQVVELRTDDLEGAKKKILEKGAELRNKALIKDIYYGKEKFGKDEIIRVRHVMMTHPQKKEHTIFTYKSPKKDKYLQDRDVVFTTVDNFDGLCDILEAIFEKPVFSVLWVGEIYDYKECRVDLRSMENLIDYVKLIGSEKQIARAMKELEVPAIPMESGALGYIKKRMGI